MKKVVLVLLFLLLSAIAKADVLTLFGNKQLEGSVTAVYKDSITFTDSKGGEKTYKMMQVKKAELESKSATIRLKGKQKDIIGEIVRIEHGFITLKDDAGSEQRIAIVNIVSVKLGSKDVVVISRRGAATDLDTILEKGKVTIVDFFAEWCSSCKKIEPKLENLAKSDPDIVLRKVDIVEWNSPVCNKYNIRSLPSIRVFDRQGKQVGSPTSDIDTIRQLVTKAKR